VQQTRALIDAICSAGRRRQGSLEARRFLDRKTANTSSAKATSPSASSEEVHILLIEPTSTPARPVRVAEIHSTPSPMYSQDTKPVVLLATNEHRLSQFEMTDSTM
jgi:hypothetical protein